jgi:hypothetical protein
MSCPAATWRIGRYRRAPIGPGKDPVIGCLFVRDVRFFPADAIAGPPPQFAPNIVQGKSYDMADPAVAGYFADVLQRTLGALVEVDFSQPWHRSGPVFGDPRLAPCRLGQQSFKAVVLDSYHRRRAISGTHIPPVLQAAHTRPVARGGQVIDLPQRRADRPSREFLEWHLEEVFLKAAAT